MIHTCLRSDTDLFFTFFLCDSYPLYGKETAKSNILVLLFQDVQMRKSSQTSYWNGTEKEFIECSFNMHLAHNIVATQMLTDCQPWLKLITMVEKHCEVSCSKCFRRCPDQYWKHLESIGMDQISSCVTKRRTFLSIDFCFPGQNCTLNKDDQRTFHISSMALHLLAPQHQLASSVIHRVSIILMNRCFGMVMIGTCCQYS